MAAQSSDRYLAIVNSPLGSNIASRVGLPRPAVLRRYRPDAPLIEGSLLFGRARDGLKGLAELLTGAGVDVQPAGTDGAKWAALVFDATEAATPAELAQLREFLHGSLRKLRSSGRVILLGRAPDGTDPERDATRQALDGIARSLAKELRAGATANLIQLREDADASHTESTLRFFLSGRSAYVDGQVLQVGQGETPSPADWSKPLIGRVALVTGAARGIGAAIAEVLSRDGATVIVADLPAAGESLAKVANRIGGTALQLDIAAPDAAERLTSYLDERHGGVDIVVHNAGITRDKLLANMQPEVWESVLAVNLQSQLRINAKLLSDGVLRDGGRVVCLASTSGIAGNRGQTNYAASKAGVIGMVRSLAPAFAVLSQSASGAVNGQVLRVCGQNLVGA
jgi:3-oxoacyl-[acyl-carrier protein] reductase